MTIKVNLLASYRLIANEKDLVLDPPDGATIRDVIGMIFKIHPELERHWVDTAGDLYVYVHVYLNKDDVNTLPLKLDTLVRNGDEIDFIPPVAGG